MDIVSSMIVRQHVRKLPYGQPEQRTEVIIFHLGETPIREREGRGGACRTALLTSAKHALDRAQQDVSLAAEG